MIENEERLNNEMETEAAQEFGIFPSNAEIEQKTKISTAEQKWKEKTQQAKRRKKQHGEKRKGT